MPIITDNPVIVPEKVYDTWYIHQINIDNSGYVDPMVTVTWVLARTDESGKPEAQPHASPKVHQFKINKKISDGDTELATLMASIITKAGTLAISDEIIHGQVAS